LAGTPWNRDGGEQADNRDHYHQFDQGEAGLLSVH